MKKYIILSMLLLSLQHLLAHGDFFWTHPQELLSINRFDLTAKYLFARHWSWGVHEIWAQQVYKEHLAVWNNFYERLAPANAVYYSCTQEYTPKHTFADFLKAYETLLQTIAMTGVDAQRSIIPLDRDGVLLDGGHRTAAAIWYDIQVPCKKFEHATADRISAEYLRTRTTFVKTGLRTEYLDAMALEYLYLKSTTYILVLFPYASQQFQKIVPIIEQYVDVVYYKHIQLSERGKINLLYKLYEGEPWVGSIADNFSGLQVKKEQCFAQGAHNIKVIAVDAPNGAAVIEAKKAIRKMCAVGNAAAHSVDEHQASVQLAQTLYNQNGLHWLNHARIIDTPRFAGYLRELKERMRTYKISHEKIAIDSGGVLAIYGMRDVGADLDIIHMASPTDFFSATIQSHLDQLLYYPQSAEQILFHPDNYFYIDGCKFVALHLVKQMKEKRNELKDQQDIALIKSCDVKL